MGGSVQNSLSVSFFPAVLELAGQAEYVGDQVAGRHVWGRGVSGPGLGEGDGGRGGVIQGENVFFSQKKPPPPPGRSPVILVITSRLMGRGPTG